MRVLGRTGLRVSALGFGCGSVGGLMVRGTPADQERAVAFALERGVNYFDTAAMYGDGVSETNLGRALETLRSDAIVASKTKVDPARPRAIRDEIARSVEASLRRLRRDRIDVFQLHTPVARLPGEGVLDVRTVVDEVLPAFAGLRAQGKIRFFGFSGTGEAAAIPELVESDGFDVAQLIYNLLNASAGDEPIAAVGADYANVLERVTQRRMGAVAIRVLAAGALGGGVARHALASPDVAPMGTSAAYAGDVARASHLVPLIEEGHVDSLAEAAIRFPLSHSAISTVLVGFSDLTQVAFAAAAVERGPLPSATRRRIARLLAPEKTV